MSYREVSSGIEGCLRLRSMSSTWHTSEELENHQAMSLSNNHILPRLTLHFCSIPHPHSHCADSQAFCSIRNRHLGSHSCGRRFGRFPPVFQPTIPTPIQWIGCGAAAVQANRINNSINSTSLTLETTFLVL